MPHTCDKLCHTASKAKALALASETYRRAYYCGLCQAWHTTSQPPYTGSEPILYRLKTPLALPL